jgi:hypothetical protein
MKVHTEIFEFSEKSNFDPIYGLQQAPFMNTFHPKPHLLLLKEERLQIISIETGLEISSWRFRYIIYCRLTRTGYVRQLQASLDFMYLGVLRSVKILVSFFKSDLKRKSATYLKRIPFIRSFEIKANQKVF